MRKRLVVGDTHGNYLGLLEALKGASFNPEEDELIVLGDTMDGWSEAPEIIEYYMRCKHLRYILGNHDLAFLIWVKAGCKKGSHLQYGHGGAVTEYVYLNKWYDEVEHHYDFLHRGLQYYKDEKNNFFSHAGWDPQYPIFGAEQLVTQEYQWTRKFWSDMYEGRNHAKIFNNVWIGHTPTLTHKKGAIPFLRRNVWNIDTGAGFDNGKVTVMNIDTHEYWQSNTARELYPIEVGRGVYK